MSGVPQGSVLGPVLFVLFINDMPGVVKTVIKLFADNAKLLGKVNNESDRNSLQNDLNKLTELSSNTWRLNFNAFKLVDSASKRLLTRVFIAFLHHFTPFSKIPRDVTLL